MTTRQIKVPGRDHPITIAPSQQRVRVYWRGRVVADTARALDLAETTYPVVHYIPREDVTAGCLERTSQVTYCPYKGDASYYSLVDGDHRAENAIWCYEHPFPAVEEIAGYLAFYPNKVDRIEVG